MPRIRVFLVEDHEQVRQGLIELLNDNDDIEVIGGVATVAEAIDGLTNLTADVAVVDVQLPDGNGFGLCQRIQTLRPETRCIIHTSTEPGPQAATAPGVAAVVLKRLHGSELLDTIRRVAETEPLAD